MSNCCHALSVLLESVLGASWREVLFAEKYVTVEMQELDDEILLIGLSKPSGDQVKLYELLRQSTKKARLAYRFFVAWRSSSQCFSFPPEDVCRLITLGADAVLRNCYSFHCLGYFRFCPLSMLSLLHLRLDCVLSNVCSSAFCYIGCDFPDLVVGCGTEFSLTCSRPSANQSLRTVVLAKDVPAGYHPLFSFHPKACSVLFVSVLDSALAAKTKPMQLTALRASLTHKIYRYLSVRWLCSLTGPNLPILGRRKDEKPNFTSAAFRDRDAATKWDALAIELQQIYSTRASNTNLAAQQANDVMQKMAKLLPFAYCEAVQRLLHLPFLDINLCTEGRYVYCLVSPFLRKLYVGAVGFKGLRAPYARFREHLNAAKMWASRTSLKRYGKRIPCMYAAIANIGISNVIQVILAETTQEQLAAIECAFIRRLSPVFNVRGVSGDVALPRAIQRLLGASVCEDVRLVGAKLLRHNRPKLPTQAWPALIVGIRRTGDRDLAAKVARQARQLCPKLSQLRSSPRLMFPCPIPKPLLRRLNGETRAALQALPFVCRSLQYALVVEAGSLGWEKTPYAETLLAPSKLALNKVGRCQCNRLGSGYPRINGHVITRAWDALPCCSNLASLGLQSSFQCRTFPSLHRICETFGCRLRRFFRSAGFADDYLDEAVANIVDMARHLLAPWLANLPAIMQQAALIHMRQQIWDAGMIIVRIDRNPGRLIVLCRELWKETQKAAFLQNQRYAIVSAIPSVDDVNYARDVRDAFLSSVHGSEAWAGRTPSGQKMRPQSYWTIKQKSLIDSSAQPVVKIRPLVTHSVHPMRIALRRLARAASILVCEARQLVVARRPSHFPMWQMHAGCQEWLERISHTNNWWGCDEYDVNDCFLNTPRHEVLLSARFWVAETGKLSRKQQCFAIAKDGKKGDHRGRPSSVHYWQITSEQLLLGFEWELHCNDCFEVQADEGSTVVLQQRKGLPIGGHLSAAFVELVALRREYECSWPAMLLQCPTTRYRDNFFVVLEEEPTEAQRDATAAALSLLLAMPVVFERGGRVARCLELRISWGCAEKVKAVLAYRTDPDRQGESRDVRTWPEWQDPRTRSVLHGLLAGLASKLVTYSHDNVGGFPASLRQALRFLRARKYPTKAWLRPFALQLARLGVPLVALPRALRRTLVTVETPLLRKE